MSLVHWSKYSTERKDRRFAIPLDGLFIDPLCLFWISLLILTEIFEYLLINYSTRHVIKYGNILFWKWVAERLQAHNTRCRHYFS